MHFVEAIEMNPRGAAIQEFPALADGKLNARFDRRLLIIL